MNPSAKRIAILKVCFLGLAVAIVGRSALLQLTHDPRLERLAHRQFQSKVTALPRRGLIFDRNGEGLAISLKVRSLFFRPELFKRELTRSMRSRILNDLAKILHMPVEALRSKAMSEKGFVWVKRQLSSTEEQAIKDKNVLDFGDGIGLVEETRRFYPNKELASHVLGSVNVDGQGLEGLELFYEGILNGDGVRIASSKDAMGRRIFRDDKGLLAIKDGQTIVLTLDKAIQYEAEKALKNAIDAHQAKAGTVIVAEVESGEILAMANYPTYNPNAAKAAAPDHRRNRAITDTYEPGSTFKPFVIGSMLEKGRSPKTQVYCERGSFKVGDRKISEATASEKYEWLTFGEILKHSSNIGAAKLALDLGASGMTQLMDKLGVGRRTEIDLPGEAPGSISRKELSSQVRLANVGFGHGFTVTPLQMLTYYLALANGGNWVQPKLVKAILAEDPDSLERGTIRWKLGHRFDATKTKQFFSPQISAELSKMLEAVVQDGGTGSKAQLAEWPVAGKTGTAQKIDQETRRYSRSKHITSFAGFAPAKKPKLVSLVVIDEPEKGYAADVAAPAFAEVMRASLLRERVPSVDSGVKILQLANRSSIETLASAPEKKTAPANAEVLEKPERPAPPERNEHAQVRLPDLRGLSVKEALKAVGGQPIEIEVVGSGILKEQTPSPTEWLEAGAKLRLIFSPE